MTGWHMNCHISLHILLMQYTWWKNKSFTKIWQKKFKTTHQTVFHSSAQTAAETSTLTRRFHFDVLRPCCCFLTHRTRFVQTEIFLISSRLSELWVFQELNTQLLRFLQMTCDVFVFKLCFFPTSCRCFPYSPCSSCLLPLAGFLRVVPQSEKHAGRRLEPGEP